MVSGVAVVTGAGSGIGRSIAHALLAGGFSVAVFGRRPDALDETLAGQDGDGLAVPVDIADSTAVQAAFASVSRRWPRLDLLVNNAGVFSPAAPTEDVTEDDWQTVLSVNVTGAWLCTQHAMRVMKAQQPQGGRIVNIGSISAHRPRPNGVAYAVSKHAVTGLSRVIALEGRDFDISCTQIDVGNAATAMSKVATSGGAPSTEDREATFDSAHIATMVVTIAAMPLDVSVPDVVMHATHMPYLGRS